MYMAAGEYLKAAKIMGESGWVDRCVYAHACVACLFLYYLIYCVKAD